MLHRLVIISLCLAHLLSHAHEPDTAAIAALNAEIRQHPDPAPLYVRRAALHLERGDWQACLIDLEHAERRQHADLALLRGKALLMGKHFEHALAVLQPLAHDPAALLIRSRAHAALGETQAAAADCQKALQLIPKPDPDHFLECADFLCRAGRRDDALALLDHAPQLTVIVARAMQLEPPDAALQRLDALIATSSIPEPLLAKRATFLAQIGREAESAAAWQNLAQRIAAMPPQARGSHAMSKLTLQSHQALAALRGISP